MVEFKVKTFISKWNLSIYFLVWVFVWVSFRLYPIKVKTAEPIGPQNFVVPQVTPEKVYG